MINLNYKDGRPIFEQVRDGFRKLILSGVLKDGEKIPSVRELAVSLAINPNTIQRAYRELETEGYICSVPGKGSFVCCDSDPGEKLRSDLMGRLASLAEELLRSGAPETELHSVITEVYHHA